MAPTLVDSNASLPTGRAEPLGAEYLIDERALSKLKWRCRRGLLENDIFIERFFKRFESVLTRGQAQALTELMDLSDNDLLDLHLSRKGLREVDVALDTPAMHEVLKMLKT